MEDSLSLQEGLRLIADTISKTRDNLRAQSFGFLLWGWLISLASISFFALQHIGFRLYFLPFPVLAGIGIATSAVYFFKRLRSSETYLNYFLNRMWMVLGVAFISVVFINVSQHHLPFTYTLLIGAIGTLISGIVIQFRPLVAGGVLLLAAAISSIFISAEYIALFHGLAIIAGYIIPGYMLKHSKK